VRKNIAPQQKLQQHLSFRVVRWYREMLGTLILIWFVNFDGPCLGSFEKIIEAISDKI